MTNKTSHEQVTVSWPTSRSEEETESHHRGFRAVQINSTSRQDRTLEMIPKSMILK